MLLYSPVSLKYTRGREARVNYRAQHTAREPYGTRREYAGVQAHPRALQRERVTNSVASELYRVHSGWRKWNWPMRKQL